MTNKSKPTESTTAKGRQNSSVGVFERDYAKLVAFKKEHGHCHVMNTHNYAPDRSFGHRIQEWRRRHNSPLTAEQKQKLVELGFCFDPLDQQWRDKRDELVTRLEGGDVLEDNIKDLPKTLASWVSTQRGLYKHGMLDDDRKAMLASIPGFLVGEDGWNHQFDRLQALLQSYDDDDHPVPCHDKELSRWIYKQRILASHEKLSQDHKRQLDDIGFSWSLAKDPSSKGGGSPGKEDGAKNVAAADHGQGTGTEKVTDGTVDDVVDGETTTNTLGDDDAKGTVGTKRDKEVAEELVQDEKEEIHNKDHGATLPKKGTGGKKRDKDTTEELVQDEKEEIVQGEKDTVDGKTKMKTKKQKKKKNRDKRSSKRQKVAVSYQEEQE